MVYLMCQPSETTQGALERVPPSFPTRQIISVQDNNPSRQRRGGAPMGMYSSFSSRAKAADDIRIAMQSLSG